MRRKRNTVKKTTGTILLIVVIIVILLFVSCIPTWRELYYDLKPTKPGITENVEIDHGNSTKFSEAEIRSAMDAVFVKFVDFKGCEMFRIWYDEKVSDHEASLFFKRDNNDVVDMNNYIVLLTDFYVDPSVGGGSPWTQDTVYPEFKWTLTRETPDGEWTISGWGYA